MLLLSSISDLPDGIGMEPREPYPQPSDGIAMRYACHGLLTTYLVPYAKRRAQFAHGFPCAVFNAGIVSLTAYINKEKVWKVTSYRRSQTVWWLPVGFDSPSLEFKARLVFTVCSDSWEVKPRMSQTLLVCP